MVFLITATIVYFKYYPTNPIKALYKSSFISICIAGTIISFLIITTGLILILVNYDIVEEIANTDLSSFTNLEKESIKSALLEEKNQATTIGSALTIVGSCMLTLFLSFLIPLLSYLDQNKADTN
ncbi:MAG: hypothetical protein R3250_03310, partial [Melioribacteraceae bacterium]|nr:hypothetical protein [Melioribacteraceae bacterium]